MKNSKMIGSTLVLFLMLVLGTSAFAQSSAESESETAKSAVTGINFFHGTFAEAKAKAAKENKLIFMDAYTVWCGPCKWMAANTFTDAAVGEYFNKYFVNMKVDMERGEGRTLARQYAVRAYPTLLFIDSKGDVKHRAMGAKRAGDFLALGKKAVDKQ
jgi:thiol:disulfide interchange protein